ncbi:MAG: T9SS type A sorting domain-containing protein [Salinivirgaceae bacterium]|jgi:hypothetical protein|nr:T9SS type A sorting domain-containing protein [Salinivirgaceae bacterium]
MRKFTATLLLSLFVFALNAQKGFVPTPVLSKAHYENQGHIQKTNVTPRMENIIWEHHFDGELWSGTSLDGVAVPEEAPEGWSLTDATGNDFYWRWDTVGPRGNFTSPADSGDDCHTPQVPLISETAHNGFMMLEANYYNTPDDCEGILEEPMNAAVVYETGIDFSGYEAVRLQFTQWSRFCCSAFDEETGAFFEISIDNGDTWISKSVFLGSMGVGNTNTGDISEVDITEMVAGESNVQFRFRLANLSHYHWEIDDIYFIEPYEYDLKALDYWNNYIEDYSGIDGNGYDSENDFVEGFYNYPWFMIQNFASYSMEVLNYGYAQQTGVMHHVEIAKNGVLVESFSSSMPNLLSNETDTSKTVGNFMPDGRGEYVITHFMSSDFTDQNPSNDTVKREFNVTENILSAVDFQTTTGITSTSNWVGFVDGAGFGTQFNLPPTGLHGVGIADFYIIDAISFYLPEQPNAEQIVLIENEQAAVVGELYRWDETTEQWVLIINTESYTIQLEDLESVVEIPFNTDGSSEYIIDDGDYMFNLAFYGIYEDSYDREKTIAIGENMNQKVGHSSVVLVRPGAEEVSLIGDAAGPCIALNMSFSETPCPYEYPVTFHVTDGSTLVSNANISIAGFELYTNEEGETAILLEPGTYPFVVEAVGYENYDDEVEVVNEALTIHVDLTDIPELRAHEWSIYPNPSNGVFNLDVDGNATVTVMNVAGQIVDSRTINGSQTITLDNVNAGVYFVRVQVGEDVGTKQLIIR